MKESPRHRYHGKDIPPQHGLRGERAPQEPVRGVRAGDRVLLIKNDGKNKRYELATVERIADHQGIADAEPRRVTLLHTNGLREDRLDLNFTWDAANVRWFVWA